MALPLTCMTLPWAAWHSAWHAWHYPKTAWHYHRPDQCSCWCAAFGDGNSNETDPSDTVDRKHTLLAELLHLQKFQSAGFHCTLHQWCPFLLHLYQSEKLHHSNQSSILLCTKPVVMHKMRTTSWGHSFLVSFIRVFIFCVYMCWCIIYVEYIFCMSVHAYLYNIISLNLCRFLFADDTQLVDANVVDHLVLSSLFYLYNVFLHVALWALDILPGYSAHCSGMGIVKRYASAPHPPPPPPSLTSTMNSIRSIHNESHLVVQYCRENSRVKLVSQTFPISVLVWPSGKALGW